MKNILFIETGTSGGGSFESLVQLALALDNRVYRCCFAFANLTHHSEYLTRLGFKVFEINSLQHSNSADLTKRKRNWKYELLIQPRFPRVAARLRLFHQRDATRQIHRIVRSEKIDLIHSNDNTWRNAFAVAYCKQQKLSCLDHIRSSNAGFFDKSFAQFCTAPNIRHIAISEHIAKEWRNRGLNPVSVIPNGITINRSQGCPNVAGNNLEDFKLCSAGRHIKQKGFEFLVRGFCQLNRLLPNSSLTIFGDGPETNQLKLLTSSLNLQSKVFFPGYVKDWRRNLNGFDLFVMPSKAEPFGRVLLESMLAGTAVVACDGGASPEVIQDRQNGILVRYGDTLGLANTMREILLNNELRVSLAENARRSVESRFSIELHRNRIESVYQELLGEA